MNTSFALINTLALAGRLDISEHPLDYMPMLLLIVTLGISAHIFRRWSHKTPGQSSNPR